MDSISFGQVIGLFESQLELSSLMDELPLGVMVIDSDRRILFLNRTMETLTGFNRDDVRGIPCRNVLRNNLCYQNCPVVQVDKNGGSIPLIGDIINRDRQKKVIRMTVTTLKDTGGNTIGFVEIVEDITTQQQIGHKLQQNYGFGQLLGRSIRMEELFRIIPVIAQTNSSVLITGETGTGKDLLAEVIHETSERSKALFIKVNCGALPETLLESELFGHKKGAFTGAVGDKPGRVRLAHNGTLYLTEIGDIPLALQVKLLTFLDDKVVYPLGSTKGFQADVRIIAATHRDLDHMVKEGHFREDLLYRLHVVSLHLPPLRERGEDINLLLDHFLKIFSTRFGKKIKGFSKPMRDLLIKYPFPGNVRELRNIIEYATNICQDSLLKPEHLPAYLMKTNIPIQDEGEIHEVQPQWLMESEAPTASKGMNWADIERKIILDALVKAKGRRKKTAEILGWCRSTLWRKMKQYQIEA